MTFKHPLFIVHPLSCHPLQVRRLHDYSVLCPEPLSYTTFTRQFSSKPNPTSFFVREKSDVAKENRNFVGIHEAGSVDTKGITTLITDADNGVPDPNISKLSFHMILPRPLSTKGQARRIISAVDSQTLPICIPTQVARVFDFIVKIPGHPCPAHPTLFGDNFHALPSRQPRPIISRFSSRQASKNLYNSSHNHFYDFTSNPLSYSHQVRHLHDNPVPYSGPPSYTTLARRFSSEPNPVGFFAREKVKRNIENGSFVDIHDVGGIDPKDYDILITDVDNDILQSEIAELAGMPYLEEAKKDKADNMPDKIYGFMYGLKLRMILPCLVGIGDKARWIFFTVDNGAPLTYISSQVAQAFSLDEQDNSWVAKIAGRLHPVHLTPPDSHFTGINILGIDFCASHRLRPWMNDNGQAVTYYFGKKWEVGSKL